METLSFLITCRISFISFGSEPTVWDGDLNLINYLTKSHRQFRAHRVGWRCNLWVKGYLPQLSSKPTVWDDDKLSLIF